MSKPRRQQPEQLPSLVKPTPPLAPNPEPPAPSVDGVKDEEYRRALFMEHQKQAWSDCQSGSDEFDKSILTYSSAGLGVSLVFIKDVIPLAKAVVPWLLYASWIAFGVAILITVISFQLSVAAQEMHLEHLRKYYLDNKPEFLNPPNKFSRWVGRLKWVSGTCFVIAITGTIVFCIWNSTEAKYMSENKGNGDPVNLHEGRQAMHMTPLEKGRQIQAMTPLPSSAVSPSPTQNVSAPHAATPSATSKPTN